MCNKNVQFYIINDVRKENKEQLFHEALTSAQRGYVIYISQFEITDIPPVPSYSRHYLKMLTFLYLKNFDAFIEGLATLSNWQNVPSTIIVDGLNEYYSTKHNQAACGLVGLLLDTVLSCSRVLNVPCRLIVSVDKESQKNELCKLLNELYGQFMLT